MGEDVGATLGATLIVGSVEGLWLTVGCMLTDGSDDGDGVGIPEGRMVNLGEGKAVGVMERKGGEDGTNAAGILVGPISLLQSP